MAGDLEIGGELKEKAKYVLKDVASIFYFLKIDYSLDCGTLLGVVRDGDIIAWDNDIDLCVRSCQIKKLKIAALILFFKGYRVRFDKSSIDFGPIKSGFVRVFKIRNRSGIFHRGPILLDVFIKYTDGTGSEFLVVGPKNRQIVQAFKSNYMDKKVQIEFDGFKYPIPLDWDGYLTARYGDWRIPVKNWNYITDDKSRVDVAG